MGRRGGNGRAATMGEVARAAGVSQSTVSRVVNGNPRVDTEVRRKVEREIRRLGYVPNMAARTLVTRRSDSVGVVIPEPASRIFGDPFFAQVLRGISVALNARRQRLVLLIAEDQEQERWLAPYLMAGHVDGIIMYSLHGDDPLPEELRRRGIQVVVGGLPPRGTRVSYVDTDNVGGAAAATAHLLALGRRVVGTVAGPQDMVAGVDRLTGYREALRGASMPQDDELVAFGAFTRDSGRSAMGELLARRPDLDGVFVASDLMASGALEVLRAAGRRVPGDVALVGFDDSPIALITDPPLTSVRQSPEVLGRELVELLNAHIGARDQVIRKVVLDTQLIVRGSCGGQPSTNV
jgi:DNA-binding LacI/PurR family transcriptional regulator